ncbi:exopolysaccharide biosynthesis protein [Alginatibacterium sediminis]|uniref:non-specific protein-tyrosine kinase n=1 Tax=Alginatibacterium sediminis TaxID=2164068 RepID=A0A420E778_9ALTE|nr:XrtA-associated tyrosine autokinase [Alginatibacterium sediminis]RKF14401.1 exopolysaccharide biosynthesis protein [Alginatibacterium sediminis]
MSTIEKAMQKLAQKGEAEKRTSIEMAQKQMEVNSNATVDTKQHQEAQSEVPNAGRSEKYLSIANEILTEGGFISLNNSRAGRKIRDEYRGIKRKLLKNAYGDGSVSHTRGNLMMVTSANPGEGKTFTSINLAMSLALEKNKTVLLVDADVLKPSVGRELGYGQPQGLTDYLHGKVDSVSDIIYNTNIDNLRIMPAGTPHLLVNEMLSSDLMIQLVNELATRYPDRIVVFDCPPLLGVNETVVLSNLVGQAIVVVQQDSTKISQITAATELLNEDLAVGYVMNKSVRGKLNGYGYGYGYGYGNGYGGAEAQGN